LDLRVRGYQDATGSRAIDTHMTRLRAKLRAGPEPTPRIIAVQGYGYKLVPPDPTLSRDNE
jgi:DNA-binding response OmpR family regulator